MGCFRALSFRTVSVVPKDGAGGMGFANWALAQNGGSLKEESVRDKHPS
jgi:hypothetical protein